MDEVQTRNKPTHGHTAHGAMYRVIVVTKAWRILRLRMQERPLNIEGSCILGEPTKVAPRDWGLGEVLTTLQRKKSPCYETLTIASGLD